MNYKLLTLIAVILFPLISWGQDITVNGTVTSAKDKSPIPGVTIQLKGTVRGTTTDINGQFQLKVPGNGVLIFSMVGMEKQEVPVNNQTTIKIQMSDEAVDLGEVVVVGYSTTSRKLVTGSVGVVGSEQIKNTPLRTIDGVLQSKTSGVQINQNSGTPGSAMSIRLRGGSSINASNAPLVVIDGIPVITGDFSQIGFEGQGINALSDLNPGDIESFTVLKDASATAIYGSRGSNGVILITTKKGQIKKTDVDLSMSYGFQTFPWERKPKLLNAAQYNEVMGTNVQGIDTDWLKEVMQTAPTMNTELSISGGDQKTRFYMSGNYYNQDGIVKGTDYERFSGRLNLDHTINSRFTIGGNLAVTYSKNNRVEGDQSINGPLPNAIALPAIYPVYDANGNYDETGPYANPVAIANETVNQAFTNRTNGNIYLDAKIIEGLSFNTKLGADVYTLREHTYDPVLTRQGKKYNGLGIEGNATVTNIVSNNVLQYITTVNEKHNIDALAGYSFEKYARRSSYIEAIDFPNEDFQYITSAGTIRAASTSATDRGMNSWFGQFKYNFDYRYLVQLTARYDGSSKFGENNQYGFFPAVSLGWRISQEKWMKQYSKLNDLKLRASWGVTGNDGISDFASLGLYSGGANYNQGSGIYPSQLPNPDLKWETTNQLGIGLDLAAFDNRLTVTVDAYLNKTKDLLLERPLPPSSGFTTITSNIGELENKGLEITINTVNLDGELKWESSFNFTINRNKVTKLYNGEPIPEIGRGSNSVREGEAIGVFWGFNWLGVDPTTGEYVYEDLNKDGELTDADKMVIGDPNPDFYGGFSNNFSYRDFELNVLLSYNVGNDIFNGMRIYAEALSGSDNQLTTVLDRWQKPGDITNMAKVGDSYASTRLLEDGSFLRIKNVTLAYKLPKSIVSKLHLRNARAFFTIQNLYTFTNYSGMDPEVNYAGDDNLRRGTDFYTYPQSRTFMAGITLGF